jgi:CRISPR-associated protein Cas6
MKLDLLFRLNGAVSVPVDHAHALYGALKRIAPDLEGVQGLGIHTLRGTPVPGGRLLLKEGRSLLRLRLNPEDIPIALALSGKQIEILGSHCHLGAPEVRPLEASENLWARMVTLKFKSIAWDDARARLDEELVRAAPTARWQIRRPRTIKIHGAQVLGFEVLCSNLDAETSLQLQSEGVGGRRAFGCGLFLRVGARQASPNSEA